VQLLFGVMLAASPFSKHCGATQTELPLHRPNTSSFCKIHIQLHSRRKESPRSPIGRPKVLMALHDSYDMAMLIKMWSASKERAREEINTTFIPSLLLTYSRKIILEF
jgi:hypothetical protein